MILVTWRGVGVLKQIFDRGVQQTVLKVTKQDLITTKNEGSTGSEPVKFGINWI